MKKKIFIGILLTVCLILTAAGSIFAADAVSIIGAEVSDEPQPENPREHAYDGDLSTRYAVDIATSADGEQWITFELESEAMVSEIDVAFYNGDQRQAYFQIEVSTDNTNWTVVIPDAEASGTTAEHETYTFDPVAAKYVKCIGYGTSTGTWFSLTDFVVKGESAAAQTPEVAEEAEKVEEVSAPEIQEAAPQAPEVQEPVAQPAPISPQTYDTAFILSCIILLAVGTCIVTYRLPARQSRR